MLNIVCSVILATNTYLAPMPTNSRLETINTSVPSIPITPKTPVRHLEEYAILFRDEEFQVQSAQPYKPKTPLSPKSSRANAKQFNYTTCA